MTPGQSPYADGDFVGDPMDRPPQDGPHGDHLAEVVPIETSRAWRFTHPVEAGFLGVEEWPADVQAPAARRALRAVPTTGTSERTDSGPKSAEVRSDQAKRPTGRRTLRKPPSDQQWRAAIQALDSAVGYLADPDIYQLLAAARSVSNQDATEWLAAEQERRIRRAVVKGEVPPESVGGSSRSTGISDPTGQAAISTAPNPDAELWALLVAIEQAAIFIVRARGGISRHGYRRGDAEMREKVLGLAARDKVSQGNCAVVADRDGEVIGCDHWCRGEGNDRLKAGLCPKHHTRWTRWKKDHTPDIGAFISSELTRLVEEAEAKEQAEAEAFAARMEARERKLRRAA